MSHTNTHTHTLTHTHTHMHTHTCTDTHTYTHTHMHTHMHRHTHVHTHTHTCLKGCFSTLLFALFEYSKWLKITGRCCWAWRPLPQVISVPFLCMQWSLCNTSLLSLQSSFACYRRRLQSNRVMIVRLCAIRCICVWVQLLLRCGSLCSLSLKCMEQTFLHFHNRSQSPEAFFCHVPGLKVPLSCQYFGFVVSNCLALHSQSPL